MKYIQNAKFKAMMLSEGLKPSTKVIISDLDIGICGK